MGRNYKSGDVISSSSTSYEIVELLNKGAMASAFKAKPTNKAASTMTHISGVSADKDTPTVVTRANTAAL